MNEEALEKTKSPQKTEKSRTANAGLYSNNAKHNHKSQDLNIITTGDRMSNYLLALQSVVDASTVKIDRPKGSAHPRYPDYIYPLDYGFLDGSQSQDGDGIDVWCGSGDITKISGVLLIADPVKKDSEIKILLGCNYEEMKLAEACSNRGDMRAMLIINEREK